MNIEDYREFCLSLGEDIEEKLPFQKFKSGEGVLVFYVMGHMFSFFDCDDFSVISLKCQPERIEELKTQYECIGNPYNESPKYWIGINPKTAPDNLLQELTRNSYEIVKAKYTKVKKSWIKRKKNMSRSIRKAIPTDMTSIMQVMEAAKGIMRSSGNMHQWTDGYPSEAVILSDMEKDGGYVVEDENQIVAYFALLTSPEPTYAKIYDGEWLDDVQPYHVVHRIASYPDAHGIFSSIMDFCFSKDSNIRIDTHRDNHIMQHVIKQYSFTYCGIIYLASGDERLAYQRIKE